MAARSLARSVAIASGTAARPAAPRDARAARASEPRRILDTAMREMAQRPTEDVNVKQIELCTRPREEATQLNSVRAQQQEQNTAQKRACEDGCGRAVQPHGGRPWSRHQGLTNRVHARCPGGSTRGYRFACAQQSAPDRTRALRRRVSTTLLCVRHQSQLAPAHARSAANTTAHTYPRRAGSRGCAHARPRTRRPGARAVHSSVKTRPRKPVAQAPKLRSAPPRPSPRSSS